MLSQRKIDFIRSMADRARPTFPKMGLLSHNEVVAAADGLAVFEELQQIRNPRYGAPINIALAIMGTKPVSLIEMCRCTETDINADMVRIVGPEAYFRHAFENRQRIEETGLKFRLRYENDGSTWTPCHSGLEVYNPRLVIDPLSEMTGSKVEEKDIEGALEKIRYTDPKSHLLLGYPHRYTGNEKTAFVMHHFRRRREYSKAYFMIEEDRKYMRELEPRAVLIAIALELIQTPCEIAATSRITGPARDFAYVIHRTSEGWIESRESR